MVVASYSKQRKIFD